ncbi:uncharacterized protein LOC131287187 [Anopheles ziemanni]|uniref:uncharacterized protein LOC131259377 n=1 Tax=Anopheles coustani TaxID=139045 RepID=UPI00265A39B9|nr:uncharacterized protein LOC131259377 [Anopheles coustani]XP_058172197.1 uncharacterized protein LOC131287187 [Anopheles ziemanni]
MGAQVYSQMVQRVHQSPAPPRIQASMRPKPGRINRAKANLFGKVESASVKQYVDQHLKEQLEAKSKKWSFDFQSERPLQNGQFEWERVQTTVPVAPAMITLTNAAHVVPPAVGLRRLQILRRSHSNSSSSNSSSTLSRDLTMEELMDERANRANGRGLGVEETLDDSLSSSTSTLSPTPPASPTSEESETIVTYPTLEDHDRIISTLRGETKQHAAPASPPPKLRQRQITEFLKERKRLSSSSVERISVKKVRLMGGASTPSSTVTSADVASTSASKN